VLRFATSTTAAVALVVPLPRRLTSFDAPLHILAGRGGVGIAALAGVLVSEYTSLFGFTECGFPGGDRPRGGRDTAARRVREHAAARVECRERGADVTPLPRAA
jgi:hypothetical protein